MTQTFRDDFDLDENLIYLNSGTHSICPRRVLNQVIDHLRSYERNPTHGLIRTYELLWDVQRELAGFLDARPEDLFLRPNVTTAMNDFILGIPLPHGGEILVSDSEYGAIANICRLRAEREGMVLRTFHLPGSATELAGLREDSLCSMIVEALRPETRLLVISHVMTGSGLALPLAKLARETRARGVILAVDGAHGVGALPLSLSSLDDLDFYSGGLHKWAMGPKGTAFGWVHPHHQATLLPIEAGWTTFGANGPQARFAPGHAFAQRMLHSACIDFSPLLALREMVAYWQDRGAATIRGRIRELQACVVGEMAKHTQWELITPTQDELRGPLLAYEIPARLQAEGWGLLERLLREHRLQVACAWLPNRWILRLSPHVYNTEGEIAKAAMTLGKL